MNNFSKNIFKANSLILFVLLMLIFVFNANCFGYTLEEKVRMEADYILACQYINPGQPGHGAINDIYVAGNGEYNFIVPRENAMAILGLMLASEVLQDNLYLERAQLAADYLVTIQDPNDGAWYNQYRYDQAYADFAKSPTQAAEVMIAFYKLGYDPDRSQAMRRGAEYLLLCKQNGFGGLICGGKNASGGFEGWNWASDNSYAYQALKAAEAWSLAENDEAFAQTCAQAASGILDGINQYLYIPLEAHWHQAVDSNGTPVTPSNKPYDWINYAPQMLDLPAQGVNSPEVGEWIHNTFQLEDGSCFGYGDQGQIRKYPGLSFQASLCWLDLNQNIYSNNGVNWAENSGLWQTGPDGNGIRGSWIDWIEISPNPGLRADWWWRFIDTSFYAIACWTGGYNFNTFYTIHLDITWQENQQTYYTAAASSQMVLNYIRRGVGYPDLTQDEIYQYGHPYSDNQEMKPDEVDVILGHFDPYDAIVSNYYDIYDNLVGGNPYQGYNFTVDTYNSSSREEYMRDICHWMAYTVTQGNWWQEGPLVARPNTPAVLPIYGRYDHWVVISGFIIGLNPCPQPRANPWNTPNFTIYGYWIKDPQILGIGQDTYKTALECQTNYFLTLNTGDIYDGMYLQVAEPPREMSNAQIKIAPTKTNEQFLPLLREIEQENLLTYPMSLSEFEKDLQSQEIGNQRHNLSWQDIIDPALLSDKRINNAFGETHSVRPIFVHRVDDETQNYYLVPFNNSEGQTSAVIVLDAQEGFFKELSIADNPVRFLKVDRKKALQIISEYIRKNNISNKERIRLQDTLDTIGIELVWQPNGLSNSCYEPYWRVTIGNNIYIVTQERELIVNNRFSS